MGTIESICVIAFIIITGLGALFVYALACASAAADDELTRITGYDHRYH